ncbi:uncharacterized protein LOC144107952 [Amblyomma americanum]|uniref:Myb-like domain-containing protein n=1 Tax=Amblyomma americanum TaxID=6943 RepID=A0AAQ4EV45_AMBAM
MEQSQNIAAPTGLARVRRTPRRQVPTSTTAASTPPQSASPSQHPPAEHPWPTSAIEKLVELISECPTVLLSVADNSAKRAAWEEVSQRLLRTPEQAQRQWASIVGELRQSKRSTPFKPYELAALKVLNACERPPRSSPQPSPSKPQQPPAAQLQIDPKSVRSITANTFMHQENAATVRTSPAASSTVTSPVIISQPSAGLTILALNPDVSITPVKPPPRASSSSDELLVVRTCSSVHTQTSSSLEEPSTKKARLSSPSPQADTASLLQKLVRLEERRLTLQQEQLAMDRQKVQCVRDLMALLGKNNTRTATGAVPNGDLLVTALSSAL